MNPITQDMSIVLLRDLEGFQREISLFPDDSRLWQTAPGVLNSAGNLALHIAGNIQHFIGRMLGGTTYARDRDREFGSRSGTRDEIIAELANAIAVVKDVVPRISEVQLEAPFEPHAGLSVPTRRFLLHLCTHTSFHLGQAGYLRRMLTGDTRSTNTVSSSRLGSLQEGHDNVR